VNSLKKTNLDVGFETLKLGSFMFKWDNNYMICFDISKLKLAKKLWKNSSFSFAK
jgi:hypothetical protein